MNALNNLLFIALPYAALALFLIGAIYRYTVRKFTFSSLSSEFLEGRKLFWGSVPFHWGISVLFFGHLIAFLFPGSVLAWNSEPLRLLILETSGFVFGISALIGMANLFIRRNFDVRIKAVTSEMDLVIEALLLIQIILGLWVALGFRWGSSWFASVLSPYLKSIFFFNPDISAVSNMPLIIKLHITLAFVIILLIPFSRLVHLLVYPLNYLWRPYQRVIWYWDRRKIRDTNSPWTVTKSKNS